MDFDLLLPVDRSRAGVGDQLTAALRAAIVDGRLVPGARLPASRQLAADLGLSRGPVVAAYEQLVAEGRLTSRRGAGTVVAPVAPSDGPVAGRPAFDPTRHPLPAAPLRPGVPDLGMFPRAVWRRAYEYGLATATDAELGYGDHTGTPRLREELAGYLGRVRAARVDADSMIITTGAAQALQLLTSALHARGSRRIAIEDPGSPGIRLHLESHGMRLVGVPVDEHGLDVGSLERTDAAAVFVTPAHQFPMGVVLDPRRRAELIGWARRTGGLIIEDDYDAEFRYDRDPVGCLQGLAPDVVALVGSASKALAPGLRRGWLATPPAWYDAVAAAKAAADLGGSVLEQLAFARLLASGGYDRQLRRARRVQRTRRDAVVSALAEHLPQAKVFGIAAGLHLVVELPAGTDDVSLAARAAAAGLGPLALSQLWLTGAGRPGLVLGYATHPPDVLISAVRRLADLVDR